MSHYHNYHQAPATYSAAPPPQSYLPPEQAKMYSTSPSVYVAAPPPIGYPKRDDVDVGPKHEGRTQTKGDGFWRGFCTGLCCCGLLDCCCCCF